LARLAPDHRKQQLAEAAALEVELDRYERAAARRRNCCRADHTNRPVDAAKADAARRIVSGDLVGHLPNTAGNRALLPGPRADSGRPVGLDVHLLDLRLPLTVPG